MYIAVTATAFGRNGGALGVLWGQTRAAQRSSDPHPSLHSFLLQTCDGGFALDEQNDSLLISGLGASTICMI